MSYPSKEDLFQIGRLALIEAGAKIKSPNYARRVVRNAQLRELLKNQVRHHSLEDYKLSVSDDFSINFYLEDLPFLSSDIEVFKARYINGFSVSKISEYLQIPKYRVYRILNMIRKYVLTDGT